MSPIRPTQRAGLASVPRMATGKGLTWTVALSGTVPPDEAHSPQKKDTRKYAQQAPHVRQGLSMDMEVTLRYRIEPASGHFIHRLRLGKRAAAAHREKFRRICRAVY